MYAMQNTAVKCTLLMIMMERVGMRAKNRSHDESKLLLGLGPVNLESSKNSFLLCITKPIVTLIHAS